MAVDMILNIMAVGVPVAMLQLIVYPFTAKVLGAEQYGFMITVYSIWMMVSNTIGNILNNLKLLNYSEYKEKNLVGDFIPLFKKWNFVNIAFVLVMIVIYYQDLKLIDVVFSIIIAFLIAAKSYLEVGFRIKIDYKGILCSNLFIAVGYLIGGIVVIYTEFWYAIFLFGYMLSVVYCAHKTKLLREKSVKTELYSKVNTEGRQLVIAAIIANLMGYLDKLVLYPLMGGYAVSIYYTATILGKIIGMLTGPINGVVLSYISRWKGSKKNVLTKILLIGTVVVSIGYIIVIFISKPVIALLFPQWVEDVMTYIPVTTITVLLMALISMVQPFVLKFCDIKWQIVINLSSVCIYFLSAVALWSVYGLMGFCVGSVIGTAAKLFIMLVIYYRKSKTDLSVME